MNCLSFIVGFFLRKYPNFCLLFSDLPTLSEILRFTHPVSKRYTDITEIPSCVRKYQIPSHCILVLNFQRDPQNEYFSKFLKDVVNLKKVYYKMGISQNF